MSEYLGTLGLCLRAGRLTAGLEAVADSVAGGDVRLVVFSADAGENTVRAVRRAVGDRKIPMIRVKADSEQLGGALGRQACAVCAVREIGFAAAVAKKAAEENPELKDTAEQIAAKNTRIASRRGKKKPRNGAPAQQEARTRKNKKTKHDKRGGEGA